MASVGILTVKKKMSASHPEKGKQEINSSVFNFSTQLVGLTKGYVIFANLTLSTLSQGNDFKK